MKIATMQYKCRMCGETFDGGSTDEKAAQKFLLETLMHGHSNCNNSIPMMLTDLHPHKGGGLGVADLIGYKMDEWLARQPRSTPSPSP